MQREIALIQSKTFWAALLGLVAVVANAFHISWLTAFAQDPHSVETILNAIAGLSFIFAIAFRGVASAKVTTLFRASDGSVEPYH